MSLHSFYKIVSQQFYNLSLDSLQFIDFYPLSHYKQHPTYGLCSAYSETVRRRVSNIHFTFGILSEMYI